MKLWQIKCGEFGEMKKPVRQKKADRILHQHATADQIKCDYAIAPVDRKALEMDQKWGIDMLPELVSVETAQKFGAAMAKMNDAINANDPEECAKRAGVVLRGLAAMDAEAERLGAVRASEDVWEVDVDGKKYGVMKDGRSWKSIKDKRPELELLTLREVALAYAFWRDSKAGEFEQAVKDAFEGAEVRNVRAKTFDDPIPW